MGGYLLLIDSVNKLIGVLSEGKKSLLLLGSLQGDLAMSLHKVSAPLSNSLWLRNGWEALLATNPRGTHACMGSDTQNVVNFITLYMK